MAPPYLKAVTCQSGQYISSKNELPYYLRMKKEKMILSSLWFGSSKPFKIIPELYTGIQCESPEEDIFKCKRNFTMWNSRPTCENLSLLCNHIQYNGVHACWKCEQEGKTEASGKG